DPCRPRSAKDRPLFDAVAAYHREPSRLAFHDLLRAFVGACRDVAQAHRAGRVHPGLTPDQIQLDEFTDGAVVGWTSQPAEPAERIWPVEAPAYASPEEAAGGLAARTTASDVYALGAILYEILAGQAPFDGASPEAVLARVQEGLPWPPSLVAPNVPAPLEA